MEKSNILDSDLPKFAKEQLLSLVDLHFDEEFGDVIYTAEEEEFYSKKENLKYDFSTLRGFLAYFEEKSRQDGEFEFKRKLNQMLSL